jgi:hypothetical protein
VSAASSHLIAAVLMVVAVVSFRPAFAVEQPAYDVVESEDGLELRRYAPYLVAETEVEGEFADAGNAAFRVLFNYISGANENGTKIAMTAPVVQEAAVPSTSSVSVAEAAADGWRVGFVVPSGYDLDSVPGPADPRISIREVPERLVVAVRFSGRWTAGRFDEHERLARTWSDVHGYEISGPAVWARYNPPFTPWFMRRNEVLLPVETGPAGRK